MISSNFDGHYLPTWHAQSTKAQLLLMNPHRETYRAISLKHLRVIFPWIKTQNAGDTGVFVGYGIKKAPQKQPMTSRFPEFPPSFEITDWHKKWPDGFRKHHEPVVQIYSNMGHTDWNQGQYQNAHCQIRSGQDTANSGITSHQSVRVSQRGGSVFFVLRQKKAFVESKKFLKFTGDAKKKTNWTSPWILQKNNAADYASCSLSAIFWRNSKTSIVL